MNRSGNKRTKPSEHVDLDLDEEVTDHDIEEERKSLENKSVEEMCKLYFPKLSGMEKKMTKCVNALHSHQEEILELKQEVKSLKNEISDLKLELQQQHKRSNENYLIVSGIKEVPNETELSIIQSFTTLCSSKLNFQPQIDCAFRIGKKNGNKPRLVKVHFPILAHRNQVWRSKKSFGHPVYVNEVLHPTTRILRSKLKQVQKEAQEKGQTAILNIKQNEVVIDGTPYGFTNDILLPKTTQ